MSGRPLIRGLRVTLAAFVGGTTAWVISHLLSSGDAGGVTPLPLLAAVLVATATGMLGLRMRARVFHLLVAGLAVACVLFWIFVPNGWWALGPPAAPEVVAPR